MIIMQKIKFVDREQELEWLENIYRRKGFKLVVIFGRRRVGKTELLKEFQKDKKHIYYLCDKGGTVKNAREFARIASVFFNDVPPSVERGFEDVFEYIKRRIQPDEKIVITIDEFPYLVEKDPAIPSIFQKVVDEILNDTEVMLILCGSSMGMMYEHTISSKSPLYGRKSGMWEVRPFSFLDVCKFFERLPFHKVVEIYSVFGNIPAYLKEVDPSLTLEDNIKQKIMQKGSPLYREPEILLLEEFRDPSPYQNILEAMTREASLSKIASRAGIEAKDMPKYLSKLMQLSLIRKELPVTQRKGKKTLYFVEDNLFYFWFRFCSRNLSYLEEGKEEFVFKEYVSGELRRVVGMGFERVCRELIPVGFPKAWDSIGRWWGFRRNESGGRVIEEIDVVALNEQTKEILFAECKWQDGVNAGKVVEELAEKAQHVEWNNNERKESFAVFAKSFSRRVEEFEGRRVYCFDLRDLEKAINQNF